MATLVLGAVGTASTRQATNSGTREYKQDLRWEGLPKSEGAHLHER